MIRYWKNFLFFQKNNKKTGPKYDNKKRFTKLYPYYIFLTYLHVKRMIQYGY